MDPTNWNGSGINSYTVAIRVSCPNPDCDHEDLEDVYVNDEGKYFYDCPKCDFDDELSNDTPF